MNQEDGTWQTCACGEGVCRGVPLVSENGYWALRKTPALQTTMVAFFSLMSFCKMFVEMFICTVVSVLIFFS